MISTRKREFCYSSPEIFSTKAHDEKELREPAMCEQCKLFPELYKV
jgi:hypothetical protein